MRIEITNLALMESIELDLTPEQSERLEKVLVNGNFYIKKLGVEETTFNAANSEDYSVDNE